MKKVFKILVPVILCLFCFSAPVSAYTDYSSYDFTYPNVIDDADIIDNDAKLAEKLEKFSDKYNVDIVVVTVESLNGKTAEAFADDFYDYNNYRKDGILFLFSTEYKDWAISTKGYGITAFTDYGCDYIFKNMEKSLRAGDFDEAFDIYANNCDTLLRMAKKGKPLDVPKNYFMIVVIGVISGLVVAVIVTSIMKKQLNSVGFQPNANSYLDRNSVRITQSQDIFLYKTLNKTRRESSSSSSGRGGSSTHRSSSGSTHGGRSGRL